MSCKSGIAPLVDKHGEYVFNNEGKANLLNNYFASVCVEDNNLLPACKPSTGTKLSTCKFSSVTVFKVLKKQKDTLSAGPDGLPPIFFKRCAKSLAEPLATLFNFLHSCETLPRMWKQAVVIPILKKGKSCLTENYRPISLTCVACKVFESVIKISLLEFFNANEIIPPSQHGFIEGHSTCINLLESLNDWIPNHSNQIMSFPYLTTAPQGGHRVQLKTQNLLKVFKDSLPVKYLEC